MMRAFRPVAGGHASVVEEWERELLARLALQVEAVLEAAGPGGEVEPSSGAACASDPLSRVGSRQGETSGDLELLAALDPDNDIPGRAGGWGEGQVGAQAGAAPGPRSGLSADVPPRAPEVAELVEVLLPEASEDPRTAVELRGLTYERLRQDKASRLGQVAEELLAPSRPGEVLVPQGQESQWLGALNDVRLVLAHRLGIESAQDAEDVHAQAFEDPPEGETFHERWRRGTALVYDMITWWQESLVSALLQGGGSA